MTTLKLYATFLLFLVSFTICHALECYVCTRQEDNVEKCLNTIKTCEHDENACLTEINWGGTPYWEQGGLKQFYISKRCSKKEDCIKTRQRNMKHCSHIWYEDWACSDCCLGDRCNYFIINGTSSKSYSHFLLLMPLLLTFLLKL